MVNKMWQILDFPKSRWLLLFFFMVGCSNVPPPTVPTVAETNTVFYTLTNLSIETPTGTVSNTPTDTLTNTPTDTPTNTLTSTPTSTLTDTPTNTPTQTPEPSIRIPAQSDWVDYGIIFPSGAEGEWDYYLWGGFAFSVIQKDDTFFLYYQGSSDYRTEYDETVMWRSIGVATSSDGIHFTKYADNPILTWFPNQNGEEGAVSSGVTFGVNNEVMLFYGANTEESATTVNADIRVASSLDGFNFQDLGVVLDHTNRSVWGSGDELFAIDAIYDQGQWIVYYIPNGSPESGKLGVAFGDRFDALGTSSPVTDGIDLISVWGTAGHVKLGQDTYALILNNMREKSIEVRLVSLQSPNVLSKPVAVYQFDEALDVVLVLDREREIWFMYYRTLDDGYGVKLAPAGDKSLPALPTP